MKHSSLTIADAINGMNFLPPIKVVLNDAVLYDDYDGDEMIPLLDAIKERLPDFEKYIVTSMEINVVSFHHSIVKMVGEKNNE